MHTRLMALLLVVTMLMITLPPVSEAQVLDSVTYFMGSIRQDNSIVAGIVHNITISLNQPAATITLKAYLDSGFSVSNFTNNYSWTYASGTWTDDLYDYYIKDASTHYGNNYCFHVAVDSTSTPGTWRWIVMVDGAVEYEQTRQVEEPVAGISMSSPTFYPWVFPYGTGYYNSWNFASPGNSTNLKTRNIGNVPLDLTITYDRLNGLFQTTNSTGTFFPGEERTHYVEFQAQSWSPRKFTVKGLIHGEPQLVMTPNTISCIIAPQTTYDVVVTVARQGYDIYQMEGVTVQYKKFYTSKYKDDFTLDMYLTGNRSVYLDGDMDGLEMNFMEFQNETYTEPLLLALTDNTESHVLVNITCSRSPLENQASILTYANFDLELEYNSATGRFTSTVVVASIPDVVTPTILEANIVVILVLVAVFIIIGIVLFMAHRKTELERRRELEERIRQKKENSRRKR